MESGDDGLESEANVRPRPCLTGAGSPGAQSTATDRGPSRDPLAQARLNRSAKGAGTGHSPRYPKCGTTQSDRLLASEATQFVGIRACRRVPHEQGGPPTCAASGAGEPGAAISGVGPLIMRAI